MKLRLAAVLSLALAVSAFGQAAKPVAPPAPAPAAPAQLTEIERLKLENIQLKFQQTQQAANNLQGEYQQEVALINAAHPGYRFDTQTGALVPLPTPEPAKK